MNFSTYVKELYSGTGASASKIARDYGVSHTTMSKILNGEMDHPTVLLAARLCILLDLVPSDLIGWDFNPDDEFISECEKKVEELQNISSSDNAIQVFYDRILLNNGFSYPELLSDGNNKKYVISNKDYENPDCYICKAKDGTETLIIYLHTRKIIATGDPRPPYKNINDFVFYLNSILFSSLEYINKYKNYIFVTSSSMLFKEIENFFDKYLDGQNKNIQLIYCKYRDYLWDRIISGNKIIKYRQEV